MSAKIERTCKGLLLPGPSYNEALCRRDRRSLLMWVRIYLAETAERSDTGERGFPFAHIDGVSSRAKLSKSGWSVCVRGYRWKHGMSSEYAAEVITSALLDGTAPKGARRAA